MYDDDDIDRGAFLLILGTLAAVIAIVSWWFLAHASTPLPAPAGEAAAVRRDLVADTRAALAVDRTDAEIRGLGVALGEPATVIVLRGEVASDAIKTRAGEIAAKVPGVTRVDNLLTIAAPPVAPTTAAAPQTTAAVARPIADLATGNPDLTSLVAQLQRAGITNTSQLPPGPFTIFAPTNNAFGGIDAALKRSTDSNVERLRKVLTYHVVPGRIAPDELARRATPLQTSAGENLTVTPGNPVKLADGRLTVTRNFEGKALNRRIEFVIL